MIKEFEKRILSSIILLPLSFYFILKGSLFFLFFLSICFLTTSYEWYMMSKKKSYHLYGYLFLILSFYSAYKLRGEDEGGLIIFLIIIIICISTDLGGYICGKIFKGPKLTKISPNKTYAGMFGSYIFSIIAVYILIINFNLFGFDNEFFTVEIFIIVFIVSTISQIGDLVISYFKRLSKIKDTGKIIPGHGGMLDRIDGMIFAFPLSYSYVLFKLLIS